MLSSWGSKMLVHLMLLQVVCFCQAKSLNRGKRSYYLQRTDSQYQPFYNLRGSNAQPRNDFYYPQVDGRPIYIPPLGQSPQDMTELLDHYYNRKAWTLAPPTDDQNNHYENPLTSKSKTNFDSVAEENRHGHSQALPVASNPITDHKEPMEYEGQVVIIKTQKEKADGDLLLPEIKDTIKIKDEKTANKIKSDVYSSGMNGEYSEYYAPEVDKTKGEKTVLKNPHEDSKEVNKYFTPEIVEKFNGKKSGIKGSEDETKSTLEYAVDDEHERPISKSYKKQVTTNVQRPKAETIQKSDGSDYERPVVPEIIKENDKALNKQQNKSTKEKQKESQAAEFETDEEYSIPAVKEKIKFKDEKPVGQVNFTKVKNKVVTKLHPEETAVERPEGDYVLPEASQKLKESDYVLPEASQKLKESDYALPEASQKLKESDYALPEASQKLKESDYALPEASQKLKESDYALPEASQKLKESDYALPEASQKLKESDYVLPEASPQLKYEYELPKTSLKRKMGEYEPPKTSLKRKMGEYEPPKTSLKRKMGEYEPPKTSQKLKEGEYELPKKSVKTKENVPGYDPIEFPKKTEEIVFVPELKKPSGKIEEKIVIKSGPEETSGKTKGKNEIKTEIINAQSKTKEKVVNETKSNYAPVKMEKVGPKPEDAPVKIKETVVTKPKDFPVKIKEKVVNGTKPNYVPVKTNEKVVSETKPEDAPVKIKEKVVTKTKPKGAPVKIKEKVVTKTKPKGAPVKIKEKVVTKTKPKGAPVKIKEKVVTKTKPKGAPVKIKEKVVTKTKPKGAPVKIKEKVVTKTKPKGAPVKIKEKVVTKTKPKGAPVKIMEKVVTKTKPKGAPVKIKEKVVTKTKPKGAPVKIKEKVVTQTKPIDAPVKIKEKIETITMPKDSPVKIKEKVVTITKPKVNTVDTYENSTNMPRLFSNTDSTKSLASLNSNIWSLVFNPNAERNKVKKCITRSNETGYCTYIQHCEVPNIATSLEQLIFNGCVMDDVFIGVCCPEFPVETVKVHWEQEPSNPNKQTEDEFGHSTDDCGIRSDEASEVQSWPWKAFLVSMSNGKIFCGGVLISEEYVLTAAHCTTKIPRNQILVRLGQYDESTGDDFVVVEIKRHAQYNPRTMHNDVALLKLGRRITHDQFTRVVCLPAENDNEDKHDGEKAILLGWKGKSGPKPMEEIEFLKVMGKDDCRKELRMNINPTVLCTEARNEDERTCNADSGAPLVIEDGGKYEVIGILSWNRNDCDQRFPATYSRVSRYVGWIRRHAV